MSWRNPSSRDSSRAVTIQDRHLGGTDSGGDMNSWYPELWSWLIHRYRIASMLDVGCGVGHAVRFFRNYGLDSLGVDGAYGCCQYNVVPERFRLHDLCDGHFRTNRKFDLVWSCEVVEHVPSVFANNVIQTFAMNTLKVLAITHALPGDPGYHHVNCQPSDYWIEKLEAVGFKYESRVTEFARRLCRNGRLRRTNSHFYNTGLVFTRS